MKRYQILHVLDVNVGMEFSKVHLDCLLNHHHHHRNPWLSLLHSIRSK